MEQIKSIIVWKTFLFWKKGKTCASKVYVCCRKRFSIGTLQLISAAALFFLQHRMLLKNNGKQSKHYLQSTLQPKFLTRYYWPYCGRACHDTRLFYKFWKKWDSKVRRRRSVTSPCRAETEAHFPKRRLGMRISDSACLSRRPDSRAARLLTSDRCPCLLPAETSREFA